MTDISKDGGVLKTIITEGTEGYPSAGDSVYVHYVGKLKETGEKFDSSRDRDSPFKFSLGQGEVIKGWDIGVASMKKGEIADLECRADYAYGENGSPPNIPPNATLIFNVELLYWEGEDISPDRDGTITKSIIVKGEKFNCPSEFASITVHAVGSHNGRVFYDRELQYILGEGSEYDLPDGVDKALKRVDKGEKCQVILKGSTFTYGSNPPPKFNLPLNAEITFVLFLKDFEKVKSSWELLDGEKVDSALALKERGTHFFNLGKLPLALQKYMAIVNLLEHTTSADPEIVTKIDELLIAGFLNSALVYLKQNETSECIKQCDKVLSKQPTNVKALYRKAQALQQRKDYDDAIVLFKVVLESDPENKAALQQIIFCKQKLSVIREKERKRFVGMFDKLSTKTQIKKANVENGDA